MSAGSCGSPTLPPKKGTDHESVRTFGNTPSVQELLERAAASRGLRGDAPRIPRPGSPACGTHGSL